MESFIISQLKNIIALVDSTNELKNSVVINELLNRQPLVMSKEYMETLKTEDEVLSYLTQFVEIEYIDEDIIMYLDDRKFYKASFEVLKMSDCWIFPHMADDIIKRCVLEKRIKLLSHISAELKFDEDDYDIIINNGSVDTLMAASDSIRNVGAAKLITYAAKANKIDMVLYLTQFL